MDTPEVSTEDETRAGTGFVRKPEIEEGLPCPQCGEKAESEQDGDLLFQSCPQCGAEFHYRRIVPDGPRCAAGLPLVPAAEESTAVFLGTTIKRRSDD